MSFLENCGIPKKEIEKLKEKQKKYLNEFLITEDFFYNMYNNLSNKMNIKFSGIANINSFKHFPNSWIASFAGNALYPEDKDKALCIVQHLVCDHIFTDGNKRMALLFLFLFMFHKGYKYIGNKDKTEVTVFDDLGTKWDSKLFIEKLYSKFEKTASTVKFINFEDIYNEYKDMFEALK